MADESKGNNSGGGALIGGAANTGGGNFNGRDDARVNISLENNDHLQAIRHQLTRLEDNVGHRMRDIERDIVAVRDEMREKVARDVAALKEEVRQKSAPVWWQLFVAACVLLLAVGLIYFGTGLYAVSAALTMENSQRMQPNYYTVPRGVP